MEYVNSKTEINGLARGIIILFIAWCVIDGANIIEKLTGVDAGLSSMTGKLIAAYHMMRGAGQTVQQARQFHMMREQRDAMRNMQATSQGGETGTLEDTALKTWKQSMEQNGESQNQNSNNTQQMGRKFKRSQWNWRNRQGDSFDDMLQSIENEMQSEQMNRLMKTSKCMIALMKYCIRTWKQSMNIMVLITKIQTVLEIWKKM